MKDKLFLKPSREGLIVRDPSSLKQLAADGEWKPKISYWFRRVRDGSVVESKPAKAATTKKSEKDVKKGDEQ